MDGKAKLKVSENEEAKGERRKLNNSCMVLNRSAFVCTRVAGIVVGVNMGQ